MHIAHGTAGWTGFPQPSHILDWCGLWHKQVWEETEEAKRKAEREETARRLAAGDKQVGLHDILAKFVEICNKAAMDGKTRTREEIKAELEKVPMGKGAA